MAHAPSKILLYRSKLLVQQSAHIQTCAAELFEHAFELADQGALAGRD
jgi:hypothetical protein